MSAVRLSANAGIRYAPDSGFRREVRLRVSEYFREKGLSPRADAVMHRKTATLMAWFASSYVGLVFFSGSLLSAIPLALSLSLAIAGIGFGIQHDANHGAYSHRRWMNTLLGASLDLVGASSYVWRWRHNVAHHCHPNQVGADSDIALEPFARMSPLQRLQPFHRFQCFYMWLLYGFTYLSWHGPEDFRKLVRGRIEHLPFPRPRGGQLALFVAGKALFFAYAIAIPALLHPLRVVVPFYLGCSAVVGWAIAFVIQLGHCTEPVLFSPDENGAAREDEWAVRQVVTSADYARASRLVSWYVAGLNFQIEHHLFPTVCHVHYPALAVIVERTCHDYGIRYVAHETMRAALASHFRFLARLGIPAHETTRSIPTSEVA